jgi:hypothetical protein
MFGPKKADRKPVDISFAAKSLPPWGDEHKKKAGTLLPAHPRLYAKRRHKVSPIYRLCHRVFDVCPGSACAASAL